jgi:hypothetical protein
MRLTKLYFYLHPLSFPSEHSAIRGLVDVYHGQPWIAEPHSLAFLIKLFDFILLAAQGPEKVDSWGFSIFPGWISVKLPAKLIHPQRQSSTRLGNLVIYWAGRITVLGKLLGR